MLYMYTILVIIYNIQVVGGGGGTIISNYNHFVVKDNMKMAATKM